MSFRRPTCDVCGKPLDIFARLCNECRVQPAPTPRPTPVVGIAACQCTGCLRYLVRDRVPGGKQTCIDCDTANPVGSREGIPLTAIRGTLVDPLQREVLDVLSEECAEVIQRDSKIGRWGWAADFAGSTQRDKLETEIGDVLAAVVLAVHNRLVTADGVRMACQRKLVKFREDAAGPRQRLLHATIPALGEGWNP